jgi:4-hydroxybenzoate polyprenyltransferase
MKAAKIISIMLAVILVANILFFVLGKLSGWFFWGIIVFCAIMAYLGIPYLRKREKKS